MDHATETEVGAATSFMNLDPHHLRQVLRRLTTQQHPMQ